MNFILLVLMWVMIVGMLAAPAIAYWRVRKWTPSETKFAGRTAAEWDAIRTGGCDPLHCICHFRKSECDCICLPNHNEQ